MMLAPAEARGELAEREDDADDMRGRRGDEMEFEATPVSDSRHVGEAVNRHPFDSAPSDFGHPTKR